MQWRGLNNLDRLATRLAVAVAPHLGGSGCDPASPLWRPEERPFASGAVPPMSEALRALAEGRLLVSRFGAACPVALLHARRQAAAAAAASRAGGGGVKPAPGGPRLLCFPRHALPKADDASDSKGGEDGDEEEEEEDAEGEEEEEEEEEEDAAAAAKKGGGLRSDAQAILDGSAEALPAGVRATARKPVAVVLGSTLYLCSSAKAARAFIADAPSFLAQVRQQWGGRRSAAWPR